MRIVPLLSLTLALAATTGVPVAADPPPADVRSENLSVVSSTVLCGQGSRHGGDLAFVGHHVLALCGNDDGDLYNDGFVIADITDPARPAKVGELYCVASASDLAAYGHLVFLAVDRNFDAAFHGPVEEDCDSALASYNDPDRDKAARIFRGFRIVDISDPTEPRLVASVRANNAGAHTVTALPQRGPDGTVEEVHVYASSPGERTNTVVRVPLAAPELASADSNRRLFRVGESADGCHDISFFTPRNLMVCDALDKGSVVLDIPQVDFPVDDVAGLDLQVLTVVPVDNPSVRHHSSAFSHDGNVLVVSNESVATAGTGRCDGTRYPPGSRIGGGVFFFDISNVRGTAPGMPRVGPVVGYQPPHEIRSEAWCTAINLNVIPTRDGTDIAVVGWYAGGTTVIDFTHYDRPEQMAYYVGAPGSAEQAGVSRASYWYNGHIYVGNTHGCLGPNTQCFGGTARGLDVLALDGVPASWRFSDFDFGRQECQFRENSHNPYRGRYTCAGG